MYILYITNNILVNICYMHYINTNSYTIYQSSAQASIVLVLISIELSVQVLYYYIEFCIFYLTFLTVLVQLYCSKI